LKYYIAFDLGIVFNSYIALSDIVTETCFVDFLFY